MSQDYEPIAFEQQDAEIFLIPDLKTRLNTLQHYFFPRLERLLDVVVRVLREVYELDPLESMTVTYRPAHRKDAETVKDYGEVFIGLTPKRTKEGLRVYHEDGRPYFYGPSSLVIGVNPLGALQVSFRPYLYDFDDAFKERVQAVAEQYWDQLTLLVEWNHIGCAHGRAWVPLRRSLLEGLLWVGPIAPFPLSEDHWLWSVINQFVALYPLLDTTRRLSLGEEHRLGVLLERWGAYEIRRLSSDEEEDPPADEEVPAEVPDLPELDNYRFVRPSLRWDVLARDDWTCCSCGRTSRTDGVILHVDHILPRSRGGSDELDNLQTLCWRCNVGKSDRDDTDLRSG